MIETVGALAIIAGRHGEGMTGSIPFYLACLIVAMTAVGCGSIAFVAGWIIWRKQ